MSEGSKPNEAQGSSEAKSEQEADYHIKSAWEVAQERAESLLKRSDEELMAEDQKKANLMKNGDEPTAKSDAAAGEVAEYIEHLQRLQAEFANYRRRVEREKAEFVKYATAGLINELTEIVDDFERGLHEDHAQDVPEPFLKGIESVYRKFRETLERQGLQRIATLGQPFDPEIHEAVMQEESDEYEPGVICGEIRPGYKLGDRLLRAPLVKVAAGSPGPPSNPET